MRQAFDIQKEFPNYFDMLVKQIQSKTNTSNNDAVKRVENLLSANMSALLARLNLAYTDVDGKPATQRFFEKLLEKLQDCLPEHSDKNKEENTIEVYIAGGVVRALLAYTYKELHTFMQQKTIKTGVTHEPTSKVKQMLQQSKYLLIRNRFLDHYKKNVDLPLNLESVYNELSIINENEKAIFNDLYTLLGNNAHLKNLGELMPSQLTHNLDDGLFEKYVSVDRTDNQHEYAQLWQAMDTVEYQLLRAYMVDKTPLSQVFVLGVGSDLDILYELKGPCATDKTLKNKIEETATQFINSAETYFNLRDNQSALKHSLVPIGDVKDYQKQMSRVLEQGGSMLDTLAFSLRHVPEINNHRQSYIREPIYPCFFKMLSLVHCFFCPEAF